MSIIRDLIISYVRENPGKNVNEIGAAIGRSPDAVSSQTAVMTRENILARLPTNNRYRTWRYYVVRKDDRRGS